MAMMEINRTHGFNCNEVCLDMAMMEINRTHGFNCKDDLDFHSTLKVKARQLLNSRESISRD